jgi:dephospho-CoA kinase
MMVLGVTGGVGSGKSTVASLLARRGARILDADAIVHDLYRPGPLAERLAARFGAGVLTPEGAVNRPRLGAVVFADPAARRALEEIVHPAVRARITSEIDRLRREGFPGIVVVDAALLVETAHPYPLDALLVVVADRAVRLARLETRGLARDEAERRMEAQADDDAKRARADVVVVNDGSIADLDAALDEALTALGRDTRTLLG